MAGSTTLESEAYRALLGDREQLAKLVPELTELAKTGSPAAVTYAVSLLSKLGHDVEPLRVLYADDRREVTMYPGGCRFHEAWLGEAVRQVSGDDYWRHPAREQSMSSAQRERHIWALQKATWLEVPTAEVLDRQRWTTPPKHDIDGAWVRDFLALRSLPMRERMDLRATFEDLAARPGSLVGRLYGVSLLQAVDRAKADEALALIVDGGGKVPWHERKEGLWEVVRRLGWKAYRIIERPVGEVAGELRGWPSNTRAQAVSTIDTSAR